MIPIRDDNPTYLQPVVTLAVIALNVLMWVGVQGLGTPEALARSVCELGLVPGELLGSATPGSGVPLGEQYRCEVDPTPSPITLVTHMFLHGGWLHLIGNLWFLWIFGNNVEDAMGHLRFAVFYLLCGGVAAAAQMASSPASIVPMVGASGAIGGIMGAYVLLYPRVWVHMLVWFGFYVDRIAVPAWMMLGYWLLLQLVGGAVSAGREGGGTAFWAHVGGFVAGLVLVGLFKKKSLVDRHPYHGWQQRPPHRGYVERLPEGGRRRGR